MIILFMKTGATLTLVSLLVFIYLYNIVQNLMDEDRFSKIEDKVVKIFGVIFIIGITLLLLSFITMTWRV